MHSKFTCTLDKCRVVLHAVECMALRILNLYLCSLRYCHALGTVMAYVQVISLYS